MSKQIIVNGEVVGPGFVEKAARGLSIEKPHAPHDELLLQAEENVINQILIKQEARETITSIPEAIIEERFKSVLENNGGEDNFYKRFGLSAKDIPMVKNDLETQLKIEEMIKRITKNIAPPPEYIIKKYYKKDQEHTIRHEQRHIAHIVKPIDKNNPLKTYNEMLDIRKQLKAGANFSELADKHSSCNDEGGDMGFFSRGQMVEEFDVIVFSMDVGEISPIFETQFGYHIATVYAEKPEKQLAYDECKNDLIAVISGKLNEQAVDKWLKIKRDKADIKRI